MCVYCLKGARTNSIPIGYCCKLLTKEELQDRQFSSKFVNELRQALVAAQTRHKTYYHKIGGTKILICLKQPGIVQSQDQPILPSDPRNLLQRQPEGSLPSTSTRHEENTTFTKTLASSTLLKNKKQFALQHLS